jgi:hypothetical protein
MSTPQVLMRSRSYWTIGLVFLAGIIVGKSLDLLHQVAYAQIPDAGLQRNAMQKELQDTNARLAEVLSLLRNQTFKVRVVQGEAPTGSVAPAPPGPRAAPSGPAREGAKPGPN